LGTVLITGSTAGLGRRVAADLAASGWDVFIHGRDPARTQAVARETGAAGWHAADLSSLQEVRRLAEEVGPLDVLVNNAGVGAGTRRAPRRELSADGHELRLAVNFLAGFLLTRLLLERIAGRVVNVASIGQAPLDFDDLMLARGYDGFRAYAQSKLAQILFTFELAERVRRPAALALHPATLMDTRMVRESFGAARSTVREGADATVRLIADPALDGVTGRYFDGLREASADPQAYDPAARRRLWDVSSALVGLAP